MRCIWSTKRPVCPDFPWSQNFRSATVQKEFEVTVAASALQRENQVLTPMKTIIYLTNEED